MQFRYDAEIEKYVRTRHTDDEEYARTGESVVNEVIMSETPPDVLARIKERDAFSVKCGEGHLYTFLKERPKP